MSDNNHIDSLIEQIRLKAAVLEVNDLFISKAVMIVAKELLIKQNEDYGLIDRLIQIEFIKALVPEVTNRFPHQDKNLTLEEYKKIATEDKGGVLSEISWDEPIKEYHLNAVQTGGNYLEAFKKEHPDITSYVLEIWSDELTQAIIYLVNAT